MKYTRVVSWNGQVGVFSVDLKDASTQGRAIVTCGIESAGPWAAESADKLIDASTDVRPIEGQLVKDPRLREVVLAQPGVRVPGALDAFELAVRAILGQQISVAGATTLAARIATRYGPCLNRPVGSLTTAFPEPGDLVEAQAESLGITRARAEAIRRVARSVDTGSLSLVRRDRIPETYEQLLSVPGIGPWTASYIALRALGDPDALVAGDLGLRQVLGTPSSLATSAAVARAADVWRPYRGYATLHIWTNMLMGWLSRRSPAKT